MCKASKLPSKETAMPMVLPNLKASAELPVMNFLNLMFAVDASRPITKAPIAPVSWLKAEPPAKNCNGDKDPVTE